MYYTNLLYISLKDSKEGNPKYYGIYFGIYFNSLLHFNSIQFNSIQFNSVDRQQWSEATRAWGSAEQAIMTLTDGVSFYNVLKHTGYGSSSVRQSNSTEEVMGALYQKHVGR